jgi:hypothetical protein
VVMKVYIGLLRILGYKIKRFRILGYKINRFRILGYEIGAFSKKCIFRILRAKILKKIFKKCLFSILGYEVVFFYAQTSPTRQAYQTLRCLTLFRILGYKIGLFRILAYKTLRKGILVTMGV